MIAANELRIGNLLEFEGRIVTVESIDDQGCNVLFHDDHESIWIDIFQMSPISITKEWLLKFGFKPIIINPIKTKYVIEDRQFFTCYVIIRKDWVENGVTKKKYRNELIITQYGPNNGYHLDCKVGFIHQIQNHFINLTKKELEIK